MKLPAPRESVAHRYVPIYCARLLIVVTDDVVRSRVARNRIYGEPNDDHGWTGLCTWDQGFRVGLFFERRELCHDLIAHEIFHATHRILERCSVAFGAHNHEPFAHLNGWLTGMVYAELARMHERVRLTYGRRKFLKDEPPLEFPKGCEK